MQVLHSKIPAMLLLLLTASQSHAEWALDGGASSFFYVTTKASAVTEINSFSGLSGGISDDGKASLAIDLATEDTAIEIRDQRMRDLVHEALMEETVVGIADRAPEANRHRNRGRNGGHAVVGDHIGLVVGAFGDRLVGTERRQRREGTAQRAGDCGW